MLFQTDFISAFCNRRWGLGDWQLHSFIWHHIHTVKAATLSVIKTHLKIYRWNSKDIKFQTKIVLMKLHQLLFIVWMNCHFTVYTLQIFEQTCFSDEERWKSACLQLNLSQCKWGWYWKAEFTTLDGSYLQINVCIFSLLCELLYFNTFFCVLLTQYTNHHYSLMHLFSYDDWHCCQFWNCLKFTNSNFHC